MHKGDIISVADGRDLRTMSRADAVDTIASKRPIVIGFAVGDALAIAESTNMAGLAGAGAGAPPGRIGAIDGGDIPEEATTGSPAVEALPAATVHKLNEIRQDMQQRAPNAYSSLVALRVREPRKCYKMVNSLIQKKYPDLLPSFRENPGPMVDALLAGAVAQTSTSPFVA